MIEINIENEIKLLIEKCKRRRKELGLSQRQVGEKIGKHKNVIESIENFRHTPNIGLFILYANALDLEIIISKKQYTILN
jgi:transcriptional regulator with XRE-family HTH domain